MKLPDELKNCLITVDEEKHELRTARKEQKVTNDIKAQTEVVGYLAEMWRRLAQFSVDRHMVSSADAAALTIAC